MWYTTKIVKNVVSGGSAVSEDSADGTDSTGCADSEEVISSYATLFTRLQMHCRMQWIPLELTCAKKLHNICMVRVASKLVV